MRDEEAQILAPSVVTTTKASSNGKKEGGDGGFLGKGKYFKLWALAGMSLLALWSVFTSSVSLKWSVSGKLINHVEHRFDSDFRAKLDVLEVEEREKKVKYMWKVYNEHSKGVRLPSFWQAAFEAAYQDLVSEAPATQNAAISEIAKMSLHPSLSHAFLPESADKTRAPRKKNVKSSKLEKKA